MHWCNVSNTLLKKNPCCTSTKDLLLLFCLFLITSFYFKIFVYNLNKKSKLNFPVINLYKNKCFGLIVAIFPNKHKQIFFFFFLRVMFVTFMYPTYINEDSLISVGVGWHFQISVSRFRINFIYLCVLYYSFHLFVSFYVNFVPQLYRCFEIKLTFGVYQRSYSCLIIKTCVLPLFNSTVSYVSML